MTSIQVLINNFPEGGTIKVNGILPTILPTGTPTPGPGTPTPFPTTPTPTPTPTSFDYIITQDMGSNLNSIFSSMLKSGKKTLLKNGNYTLSGITFPQGAWLEGESHNAIINAGGSSTYLITLGSNDTIKKIAFRSTTGQKFFLASGTTNSFTIDENYFYGTTNAVTVKDATGSGTIINNTGLNARLGTLSGTRNNIVKNNVFKNHSGDEFFDFNGNAHFNTLEGNTFTNDAGFTLTDEAIDMIGNNTNNILRNNYVKGNFQRALRPSYEASDNLIENNYFEYIPGVTPNGGGIVLWNSGAIPSKIPKRNRVIGNTIKGMTNGINLSGAQDNIVTGNKISNCIKGINIQKDTYKGASAESSGNTVQNNDIYDVDYGIYWVASPNNIVSGNNITNYRKGSITKV